MLINEEQFYKVENYLRDRGSFVQFEKDCGPITGRMMITAAEIPDEIDFENKRDVPPAAFEASFDFYDSTLGLALYPEDKELAAGVWFTRQKEDAELPAKEWVEFFIKTLVTHIGADGSYGLPMYSFLTDTSDITVVPAKPE